MDYLSYIRNCIPYGMRGDRFEVDAFGEPIQKVKTVDFLIESLRRNKLR